ncbi:MAG TPA: DinB family protein [Thermoanaerobaculia bacterium]
MPDRKQLVIGTSTDVPLPFGALLDMLAYAREQTLKAVEGLSVEQLAHRYDEKSNSIGALLWHIAAVETWYQVNSFDEREWSAEDAQQWDAALDMGDAAIAHGGYSLHDYVEMLAQIRARTERELRTRDSDWLLRVAPLGSVDANNYWKWFHVCEDEINHRGQIRWLRKRLPGAI